MRAALKMHDHCSQRLYAYTITADAKADNSRLPGSEFGLESFILPSVHGPEVIFVGPLVQLRIVVSSVRVNKSF
jgi:hypothetical protein